MERGAVLVTGASTGIGRAAALRLAARGYLVVPGLRRPEPLPDPVAAPVTIDLAEQASVERAAAEVTERYGERLVGLVNNAGYTVSGPVESLDIADWRAQFEVNFFGHLALTKALLPALLSNRGRIVNVGSVGGRFSAPFVAPYSASKFAVRAWSDALRLELAPHGVHVALVEPGAVATEIWRKGNEQADEQLARLTPEQAARYEEQIRGARKVADFAAGHAIPADKCADAIEHALTSRHPKGRYLVGLDARLQATISVLPTRLFDRAARTLLRQPGRR